MTKALAVSTVVALCLLACSKAARMDTSSSAASRTSSKEVAESLPGEDAKRFWSAMGLIAALDLWERNPALFARALALGPTPLAPPSGGVIARVHGLTADEVVALADQLAAETQRVHGLAADDVIALADRVAAEAKAKEEAARAAYQRAARAQLAEEAVARAIQAAYFPSIEIRNLETEKGSSPSLSGPYAKVVGEVKNLGDKTLDKVELTITLLDGGGKPVAQDKSHTVSLMRFDRDGEVAPLKPNDARKFAKIIKDPPSEWAGRVEARTTAVKFAEPK